MQLSLSLPDELVQHFSSEEELRRTVYEDFVIEQRQSGMISLSKAAELLELSYAEFFALQSQKGLLRSVGFQANTKLRVAQEDNTPGNG
jgi:predicted HTH domain antitoxin